MTRAAAKLMAMYSAMRKQQGCQDWWPGENPLEICVGAILTQNTNWGNVEKAIGNLKAAGALSVSALNAMPRDDLAQLIRPAGYFNVKAKRLKSFISRIVEDSGGCLVDFLAGPVGRLRETLLSVHGIGPETADSMILYAAGKPVFVVDAYTRRILLRHGLIQPNWDYEAIRGMFESSLRRDVSLWNDFHAQIVMVGKDYCKPKPKCSGCPLVRFRHDCGAV